MKRRAFLTTLLAAVPAGALFRSLVVPGRQTPPAHYIDAAALRRAIAKLRTDVKAPRQGPRNVAWRLGNRGSKTGSAPFLNVPYVPYPLMASGRWVEGRL